MMMHEFYMINLNKGKIDLYMYIYLYKRVIIYFSDEKMTIDSKEFSITRKMFTFRSFEKTVQGKRI
jgi:hypothetical protein